MILYVNACVRKNSRTKKLAEYLISKLDDNVMELILSEVDFPITDENFLLKRDEFISKGDYSDKMFDMAKQFAQADTVVIAAPFWDLSFPAALKQFFEHINVTGLTFMYSDNGIPVGLCKAKSLYYVTTAGGTVFSEEYGYGYVQFLARNFYGISEIALFKAENLDIIGADETKILDDAKKYIDEFFCNKLSEITVNGMNIHYVKVGKGKPVILLHGNGESHELFFTQIVQLVNAGYCVYAPDSRGHGANQPIDEYHYSDMAEDIFQFIKALNLEKPAVYGHSDGGIIALMLEIMHENTLGILAVSGTNLSPKGLNPSFLQKYSEINQASPDPLITLMLTEPDIQPSSLSKINIPVLVAVGENDIILPEETERIVSGLSCAVLKIIPDADHGSYIVNSPVMGEMLVDFFRENWK